MNHRDKDMRMPARLSFMTLVLVVAALVAGCELDPTNPGPVQDEFLNDPGAFDAIVNGMGRGTLEAMNFVAFEGAAVTRELHPTGGTGSFGLNIPLFRGEFQPDEINTMWNNAHQARWVSEDGLRRMEEVLGSGTSSEPAVARGNLWAGFTNRLLGENMCQTIIDGGAPQPKSDHLSRAEGFFTAAIEVADNTGLSDVRTAALAGRASVRAFLGDWSGAASDAAQVPDDFEFVLPYFDVGDADQWNRIHESQRNQPYKTSTVWNTWYADNFVDLNDPRTSWVDTGESGDGSIGDLDPPLWRQLKYDERDSDIQLVSGSQARLIEAEALLVTDDMDGAMAIIDDLRERAGADALPAPASMEEAWAILKREWGIETWLEGRRLGQLYRWDRDGTPGALDPLEVPGEASNLVQQDLCVPISESEQQTNPNL